MRVLTFAVLFFVLLLIFACVFRMRKINYDYTNRVFSKLMYITGIVILLYAAAIAVNDQRQALVLYSLYFIFLDLMLLFMVLFIKEYVQYKKGKKMARSIFNTLFVLDCINMITNIFHKNVFRVSAVFDMDLFMFYRVTMRKTLFFFHLAYVYLLIFVIFALLIEKTIKTSKVYKDKYIVVIGIMCFAITMNILYMVFGRMYDFSVISYGCSVIAIYYYIYYFKPYRLVNNLFSFVIRNSDSAILCFDINSRCIHANETARKLFHNANRMEDFTKYYLNLVKEKNLEQFYETSWSEVIKTDDDSKYFEVKFQKLSDAGKLIGSCLIFEDQTTKIEENRRHRYLVSHDVLTGINNKEYFFKSVSAYLKQIDEPYCMVCTDVQNFKMINDVYGEEKGNEILIRIANMLKQLLTGKEFCCRLQGDRFAICMPKSHFNEEDFVARIRRTSKFVGTSIPINMYVGVYDITDPSMDVSVMCDRANLAINSVKNGYEGVVVYYDESMRRNVIKEQSVMAFFPDALASGQFQMYLQPQISTTGKVVGAEVLTRWIHPVQGIIQPRDFIPIYEKTNLISKLDLYIWQQACQLLSKWKKQGKTDYSLSVNISTKDFYFLNIYEVFTGLVEEYDISPGNLHLEITETAVMSDMNTQIDLIKRLQNYGFFVEMDDFGSGYSSLNMLSEFNVDTLKIDMGFLRNSDLSEKSKDILQSVVVLAKELGMHVISEGVETKEQYEMLIQMGIDIVQGYFFAKPMRVDDFEKTYLA